MFEVLRNMPVVEKGPQAEKVAKNIGGHLMSGKAGRTFTVTMLVVS